MKILTLLGYLLEREYGDSDSYDNATIINLTFSEVVRYIVPIITKITNEDEIDNFLKNSTNKKYGIYIERNGISEIYCMDTEDEQISYNIFDRINNYTKANNLYGLYILMCDKLITKESQR